MFSGLRFRIVWIIIVGLVVLNVSYISYYIISSAVGSNFQMSGWFESSATAVALAGQQPPPCSSSQNKHGHENYISIDFNIMDIYRIDMSCEYITEALGSHISIRYANKPAEKRCSYSSLGDHSPSKTPQPYRPITSVPPTTKTTTSSFDPFDPLKNLSPGLDDMFKSLKPGGEWIPSGLKYPCNSSNIDYVVFIVPFTRSRIENLKLFLINMHAFLQKVENPFR